MAAPHIEFAEQNNDTALYGTTITEAQMRDACTVLAGKALDAAGGDWEAAKAALGPVLEAVGAADYETAVPRGAGGRLPQARKTP